MNSDTIKLLSSHLVAVVACIGGTLLLVYVFFAGGEGSEGLIALIAGFVGLSFQFLYQTNTQSAARAQTRNDLLTPAEDVTHA